MGSSKNYYRMRKNEEITYLLIGASSIIPLPFVPDFVRLPFIIAMVSLAISFPQNRINRKSLYILPATISLGAYIFAALMHHTPLFQRHFSILLVLVLTMAGTLFLCRRDPKRILAVVAGHSFATILGFLLSPTQVQDGSWMHFWKFAIAIPTTVLILYICARYPQQIWLPSGLLFSIGIYSVFMNYRSHGLACIVAAALFLALKIPSKLGLRKAPRVLLQVFTVLGLLIPVSYLPAAMENGAFGPAVQAKALSQSDGGPIIFAGRTEPAMSFAIIREHPITGWGSIANVPDDLVREGQAMLGSWGVDGIDSIYQGWYRSGQEVSLHSVLAQHWVEAGFFGAVFVLFLGTVALRASIRWQGMHALLVIYLAFQLLWDLFFSPYISWMVLQWGLLAALFVVILGKKKNVEKSSNTINYKL